MYDQEPVSRIVLPEVPSHLAHEAVAAWSEPISIDTYQPEPPDGYPAFLDSRVYQGSSGKVFPLPFHERVSSTKEPRVWQAVHLENEWVRLVVLPELGGRIHIGYDKVARYDFFYRNNVIKPALVGLAGPWLSGGVEFNWPQHHRPATFLPTDVEIEQEKDGAVTVWMSDHDPFTRMKGMHGIRLRPDSTLVEARVRLYNRSELPQTFLWWANVAAAAGPDYQSFFPSDVSYVADHARRAITAFPAADRPYYGIDYPSRRDRDNPDADRIDWYKNVPVPTSYMIVDTEEEFFGGYDHQRDAGFVHWASREISPGKKQWTWGNAPFGWAWDANLTDDDGPYVELMAGVYTDNQPDFAWIGVGETKSFSQYWYPVHGISGVPTHACREVAVRFPSSPRETSMNVVSPLRLPGAEVVFLDRNRTVVSREPVELTPGAPQSLGVDERADHFEVTVGNVTLLRGSRIESRSDDEPPTALEPPLPAHVEQIEELVLIAQYLHQYRHATRSPEPYWREALARDPGDTRSLTALGSLALSRGQYETAVDLLRRAVDRQTMWAPTQRDGEARYLLGLAQDRLGESVASSTLARAAWSDAWSLPAGFALARIHARQGAAEQAMARLAELIASRPDHLQSRNLLCALLITSGRSDEARPVLERTLQLDPLDQWARWLADAKVTSDAPTLLDVALEFAAAELSRDALEVLSRALDVVDSTPVGQVYVEPIIHYHRAVLFERLGHTVDAQQARDAARSARLLHCQASRLDDADALREALTRDPRDTTAALLLANWLYDRSREAEAMHWWKVAAHDSRPEVRAIALRNLGVASFNIDKDGETARQYFGHARESLPGDAKLLYEQDQLHRRLGVSATERLANLESARQLVAARDDLTVVHARLLVEAGHASTALALMAARHFQPWEGGEGLVLAAWDDIHLALARQAIDDGAAALAESYVMRALNPPPRLGEARHPLANAAEHYLVLGDALSAQGESSRAREAWSRSASFTGDFAGMSTQAFSAQSIHSIAALCRLELWSEVRDLYERVHAWVLQESAEPATIDYFATSLPSLLLFVTDPQVDKTFTLDIIKSGLAKLADVVNLDGISVQGDYAL